MRLKQESLQRGGDTKSVELVMENGAYPLKGSLQFSDVTVDESTGSITLRAIFLTRSMSCCGDVRPRPHRRRRRSAGYPVPQRPARRVMPP